MRPRNVFIFLLSLALTTGIVHAASNEGAGVEATAKSGAKRGSYVEPKITHEQYAGVKIVVPITTDDKAVQGMKLRNIENSLEAADKWGGQMQSTVVLYAKGVSLLKNPDAETKQKIDALKAKGVQFDVCDNTLREQGIDFHQLYHVSDGDIVPSGFAEVAYLQSNKNYVVDPIN